MKLFRFLLLFIYALTFAQAEEPMEELPPVDKMPEVTTFVSAGYPPEAMKKGIEGSVLFEIVVSETGEVDSISIINGIDPSMDSSALAAIRQFTFSPATAGGEPVAVMIQYEYHFTLKDYLQDISEYVNFTGRIREKGTRSPVADGMVVISFPDSVTDTSLHVPLSVYLAKIGEFEGQSYEDGRIVTTTDSLGMFSFTSLPSCSIGVAFPIPGYRPASNREFLEKGKAIEVDYTLTKEDYNEFEIVVYGKADRKEVAKKSLSLQEVKRVPGFSGDAIKVVQALPGVARPSFASGEIIVRGSGLEDTRYFLDGVDIPKAFHLGGLKSTYNSDLLSSVDMYPGGFNTRYGGGVGGVIEIKGRPAKRDRWHGVIDVNFLDASFVAEGPLTDKVSLACSARKSYIGTFLENAMKDAPTVIVPEYWDIVSRLDYTPSPADRIFLTYFSAKDKMDMYSSQIRGGSTEIDEETDKASMDGIFHNLILGYDKKFNNSFKNELRFCPGYSWETGGMFGFNKYRIDTYSLYLRDQLSWSPSKKVVLNGGIDADIDSMEYSADVYGSTGIEKAEAANTYTNLGIYANSEITLFGNLSLLPGVRYDYFKEIDDGAPSFRLTTRYNYRPGHTIKTAFGTYSQTPRPFGQAIDTAWGNPDLPPTLAHQYVTGYEWQITDLISLDAQAYFNRQYDIPRYADDINPKTGEPYNFLSDMDGRMYGLEIMLRHDHGKRFFGWLAYSLSRSERRAPGPTNQSFNRTVAWNPDKWVLYGKDQTHNLQLVGSWRLPHNWETGFRFRYTTGNPETPLLSFTENKFVYDSDYGNYVQVKGEPFSERVDPFVQLDIRVDKRFVFKNWMLSAYLDIQNVNYFFYNSPEEYQYNYDGSERETIGSLILPSCGIRAEF